MFRTIDSISAYVSAYKVMFFFPVVHRFGRVFLLWLACIVLHRFGKIGKSNRDIRMRLVCELVYLCIV